MSGGGPASADVAVVGATAGGVAAAVAAARAGASVVLVASGRHLGGMLTGGLSRSDIERQESLIGGMAREVFERIAAATAGHPSGRPAWRFEPHVAESVLEAMAAEAGVTVLRDREVGPVTVVDRRVRSMTLGPGLDLEANVWVDATYEGDLLAAAGASFRVGREDRALHGERWAGRLEMLPNPHQARAPVDARGPDGQLLPGVVPYLDHPALGMGDGRLQPACFRLCLSRAHDRRPLTDPPPRYDRSRYVLVERYLASLVRSGARLEMHDVLGVSDLPNGKVDVNSHGPFSTNLPGGLDGYLGADRIGRAGIVRRHRDWAAGLLHFLATDAAVPDPIRAIVEPLGYPADEFVDDDGWPHQLYIRDARRLVGETVVTEADLATGRIPGDTVVLGGYNIDIREIAWVGAPIPRFPDLRDEVLVEGYLSVPVRPYGIPYRALRPRRDELTNLLVAICVSASAVAFASIRMEPTYLALGGAAGVAAATAARRHGGDVHAVDADRLRADLERAGQVLRAASVAR
jgi:hypothetical protein